MVTDPQTNKQPQTHKETGPKSIHCAAKLSTQCNESSVTCSRSSPRIKTVVVVLCPRLLYSTEPTAFHGLFLYLEDRFIVKDKSEMWKCIRVVAQKAFEMFLSVKSEKVSDILVSFMIFITFRAS